MSTHLLFVATALVVVVVVLLLLRSRRLREKYALLWVLVGAASVVLGVFPGLLVTLAGLLGVAVPANLLFALAILLLLGVCLHLSLEVSRAEDEVRSLAEQVAILNLLEDERRARELERDADA